MKYFIFSIGAAIAALIFDGCCGTDIEVVEFCEDQVFVETRTAPVEFTYTVNKTGKFLEAHKLTAENIRKALKVEGSNFKVKRIELTSAFMSYKKELDNSSAAMFVNIGAVDNGLNLILLMKQNQLVPLVDIPATIFTPEVNINKYLNDQGVKEIARLLQVYAEAVNDEGISFALTGEGSPANTHMHFHVKVKMNVAVQYEVCRYVPLGTGLRVCK
ncbi:MAG: hypothetical protein IPM48_08875 [Saprospiraceae bacterium]|nr:hypothetical protein [Saprospiraceae bacterium]